MDRCAYCRSEDTVTPMTNCRYCKTTQHGECRAEHGGSCVVCGRSEPIRVNARSRKEFAMKIKKVKKIPTDLKLFALGGFLLTFGLLGLYLLA